MVSSFDNKKKVMKTYANKGIGKYFPITMIRNLVNMPDSYTYMCMISALIVITQYRSLSVCEYPWDM